MVFFCSTWHLAFLFLGFSGLIFSTVGIPLVLGGWGFVFANTPTGPQNTPSIAILIPAHNEEKQIRQSLQTILASIQHAKTTSVEIHVALDGCTDNTKAIVQSCSPAIYIHEQNPCKGKWQTLMHVISKQTADWIVLADAGIQWPKSFLAKLLEQIQYPNRIGIAPAYRVKNTLGFHLESKLKKLENLTGGPISVHGATVAYKREALFQALHFFSTLAPKHFQKTWLNDDVVIPLTLRMLFPEKNLFYWTPSETPFDLMQQEPQHSNGQKIRQRIRMTRGNIQWLNCLLPYVWKKNKVVFFLSLRRVFRIFWAYWIVAVLLALPVMVSGGILCIALLMPGPRAAFFASLLAPFELLKAHLGKKISLDWK